MAKGVVIDHDITGWGKSKQGELSKSYQQIEFVGSKKIPRRERDEIIAKFCLDNDYHLLTGDGMAYTHYFKAAIKEVQISVYEWYESGEGPYTLSRLQNVNRGGFM